MGRGRKPELEAKIGREVRISQAESDFAGKNLSLMVRQHLQVQMGRAMSLEEFQRLIDGNINNVITALYHADKRPMDPKEHDRAMESLAKIRGFIGRLEGHVICRRKD